MVKPLPSDRTCSSRRLALEVARLLRWDGDAKDWGCTDLGRSLLALCGNPADALAWVDRVIVCMQDASPSGLRARKLALQASIVARYDRAGENRTVIANDLAISTRRFYKERFRGLIRLAALIAESESQRHMKILARQPWEAALAEVDAHDDAGETERALSELRTILPTVTTPPACVEVLSRMVSALTRVGRMAEANHVAMEARRCLGSIDTAARQAVEGRFLLSELCRTARQGNGDGYDRALATLRRKLSPSAGAGDQDATRTLTLALLEHAMSRVDVGDSRGAEAFLREAEVLAARILDLPIAVRIQASIVRVGLHVDRPEHFATALREGAEVYRSAQQGGLLRLATQALYQCTSAALIARKPRHAAAYGQMLLTRARVSGDADCLTRANFALAGADHLLGHYDRALRRLASMQTPATAGSIGDMLVNALRARVLCGLRRFDVALGKLQSVIAQAAAANMEQAVALALLLKSRIGVQLGDVRGARNDVSLGLNLLQHYPTPLQLVHAYQHAFSLTGRSHYRDDAGDLWRLISPAFIDEHDFGLLATEQGDATRIPRDDVTCALTRRQRMIAEHVSAGRTNREIAALLGLSVRTVDQHVRSTLQRLNVERRWQISVPAPSEAS